MLNRILFSYVSVGSGHRQAAEAIQQAMRSLYQQVEIIEINALTYFHPVIKELIAKIYLDMLKSNPDFWDYLYDNEMIMKLTSKLKGMVDWVNSKKLKKVFKSFEPEAVVCTHAFPCGIFSSLKENKMSDLPLIAVMTDFDVHGYWVHKNVSFYCVANNQTKKKLIKKGIAEERIGVFGIPINPIFNQKKDVKSLREKLGLRKDLPVLLIMGGSLGLGPIERIVCYLNNIAPDFQMLVVTGKNQVLREQLERLRPQIDKEITFFGYVKDIDELMKASDILISKSGGLTCAEALASARPMIIVNPIPGQEERNSRYLTQQGVAIKVEHEGKVGEIVEGLLYDRSRLEEMKRNALRLSQPLAAFKIVEAIERTIGEACIPSD